MSSYKKPALESFGTFREVTKFDFFSYFSTRLRRRRLYGWGSGTFGYPENSNEVATAS